MPPRSRLHLPGFAPALALLLATASSSPSFAELGAATVEAEEETKRLVAMLDSSVAGSALIGAALIVGVDGEDLILVTSDHLVRAGGVTADRIELRFYERPDERVEARLLHPHSPPSELDIAVLRVPGGAGRLGTAGLRFDRLPPPGRLRRGDGVLLLGRPNGKDWLMSINPDLVAKVDGANILFESRLIASGHSGGVLLDEHRRIVGLLRRSRAPLGEAVAIERVLEAVRSWSLSVSLALPLARISAGGDRTCRVDPGGNAECWGPYGRWAYAEDGPIDGFRFRQLSVGRFHSCGIDAQGVTYCWGLNNYGQLGTGKIAGENAGPAEAPLPITGAQPFEAIAAGGWHTCALSRDARAYCWGAGTGGRLGLDAGEDNPVPTPVAGGLRFQRLSAGSRQTCGITSDGEAWCWGGVLGTGKDRSGMDPPNAFVPVRMAPELRLTAISTGGYLTCAIADTGAAWCWGSGAAAGVGLNAWDRRDEVVAAQVPGRLRFASLSTGPEGAHACGLTPSGAAYCWGLNGNGQLGNGTTEAASIPVPVAGGLRFDSISAGWLHTCGITRSGSTCCWGGNRGAVWPDLEKKSVTRPVCRGGADVASPPASAYEQDDLDRLEDPGAKVTTEGVLARHRRAMGGPEGLAAQTTRVSRGTLVYPLVARGGEATLYQKAPDKWKLSVRFVTSRKPSPGFEAGFDGARGWARFGEGATHTDDTDLLRTLFPLHAAPISSPEALELRGRTQLDGQGVFVLESRTADGRSSRFYLGADSGQLLYAAHDLGRPGGSGRSEVYASDHREQGGTRVPFVLRAAYHEEDYVLRFEAVEIGVELDDEVFQPPTE